MAEAVPRRALPDPLPPLLPTVGDDAAPVLCTYLVVLLLIPSGLGIPVLGSAGAPATLVAVALFGWWLWDLVARDRVLTGSFVPVEKAALLLGLTVLVSYAGAMGRPIPLDEVSPADSALLRMAGFVGVIVVTAAGLSSWSSLRTVVRVLLALMGALTLLAFVQVASGQALIDRIQIPGLVFSQPPVIVERTGMYRPSATAVQALEFGALIGMSLPLAVACALATRRGRWPYLALTAALGMLALFTLSRSALITTGIGLVLMVALVPGTWRRWAVLGGSGGFILAGLVSPGLWGTLLGLFTFAGQDPSVESRVNSYPIVLEHFLRTPIIGRGFGTFLPKYWILDNMYLQLLVEIGLLGLAAMLGLLLTGLIGAGIALGRMAHGPERTLLCGLFSGLVSGSSVLLFFDALAFAQSAGALAVLLGLTGAAYRLHRQTSWTGSW